MHFCREGGYGGSVCPEKCLSGTEYDKQLTLEQQKG